MREKIYELDGKSVWVAGHSGLVGGALLRRLDGSGANVLTADRDTLDLRDQTSVRRWIAAHRPQAILFAAGTVGGIEANRTRPAEFLYENLMMAANVIAGAAENGVEKLLFLGSSCFYPADAEQPVHEETLLTAPFEPTNEWYAVAKVAGVKLCQAYRRQHGCDFITAVPTNLYGPGDNFHPSSGHVIPALMGRIHHAKQAGVDSVEIWGTGRPEREFLYVDDAADALIFLMERYSGEEIVNVAGAETIDIAGLADMIASEIGYRGSFHFDTSRPDGTLRKGLDPGRILGFGWRPRTPLREGIARTYAWYLAHETRLPLSRAPA